MDINLSDLSTVELTDLYDQVGTEVRRREALAEAEQRVVDIQVEVLTASGREMGAPWVAPSGAHDAYPEGWEVTHDGKTWESLVAANVWEPGVSGWREVVEEGGAPAEFVQPTGAHDAYQTGDRVTFEGQVYRSLIDGNVWSPADHPAGWGLVS